MKLTSNSTIILALLCLLTSAPATAQQPELQVLKIKNTQQLHAYFKYTGKDIPLISGHRGGTTKGFPENCIATFENTLRYAPAFFEIDPRLTKDSIIVLMHDDTLDRTTNGTGKVADYTWEQLKKLKLKDSDGNLTPYGIPTLDEVITWSKGKTILNLDKKDVPLEMTARKLAQHQAFSHVMLTVHTPEQAKYYLSQNKDAMFSAFVKTPEALNAYEQAGVPWTQVMAYVGPHNKPENKVMYDLLHARGVMCMISAAPTYDKLKTDSARETAYRNIILDGADVIESDLPIEAAAAINALLPAKSTKQKFFSKQK